MLAPGGYDLLKNKNDGSGTKTVFFVKGTDSLHRAFNEYFKIKVSWYPSVWKSLKIVSVREGVICMILLQSPNKPQLSIEFDRENGVSNRRSYSLPANTNQIEISRTSSKEHYFIVSDNLHPNYR